MITFYTGERVVMSANAYPHDPNRHGTVDRVGRRYVYVRPDVQQGRAFTDLVKVLPQDLQRVRTCSRCRGNRYEPHYSGSYQGATACLRCDGKGYIVVAENPA